jgi:hypothetical protein
MRSTAVPERPHYLADRRNHPALIRRRDPDALQEMRLACFGDVHAGMIPRTAGNPGAAVAIALRLLSLQPEVIWRVSDKLPRRQLSKQTFDDGRPDGHGLYPARGEHEVLRWLWWR